MNLKLAKRPLVLGIIVVTIMFAGVFFANRRAISAPATEMLEEHESPAAPETGLTFLRVEGDRIVNERGDTVFLRGFQGLASYGIDRDAYRTAVFERGMDPYKFDTIAADLQQYSFTDWDIAEIQSTGANVVRIWYLLHEIEKRPYEYSETSLELLEQMVNKLGEKGIYSILVMSGAAQHDFETNKWYAERGISMWRNDGDIRKRALSLLGVIAKRFKNNPFVAGYDVINEPKAPNRAALKVFYDDAILEIRRRDTRHILFVEVDVEKEVEHQMGGAYSDTNLVASFHFYRPRDFTLDPKKAPRLTYPGRYCAIRSRGCQPRDWNRQTLEEMIVQAINLPDLRGKPIYVGEFGASSLRDPDGLRWIEDMLSIMNSHGLHYTYHSYRSRDPQGGFYLCAKPDVLRGNKKLSAAVISGKLRFEDITPEQKDALRTENRYERRQGIRELLRRYFNARQAAETSGQ